MSKLRARKRAIKRRRWRKRRKHKADKAQAKMTMEKLCSLVVGEEGK
jgi:hypothetical protein